MSEQVVRFEAADVQGDLPEPGLYEGVVIQAGFAKSKRGNAMVTVLFEIAGVPPGRDRVAEYFVIEGGSARGRSVARRQLVELYRACNLEPQAGEEIDPGRLIGTELEVKLEHDDWEGGKSLRVAGHRPRSANPDRY